MSNILDSIQSLLVGEPARVIGYGAAVVIYIVAKATVLPDQTLDQSLALAAGILVSIGSIIEPIRHFVYSPASVAALVAPPEPLVGTEVTNQ